MSLPLLLGARGEQGGCRVVNCDECQDKPRRVVRGQLPVQEYLFGDRHPAAPLARPVRNREARAVQLCEPVLLESDEFLVAGAGLSMTPIVGYVLCTPRFDVGPELVEIGGHVRFAFCVNARTLAR